MTRFAITATAALALCTCGGMDESAVPVGTAVQAVVQENEPPPVEQGPQRLSNEALFKDSAGVVRSPEDRTLAETVHYQVEIKPPPCR